MKRYDESMYIVLDFDRTLFDTNSFAEKLLLQLEHYDLLSDESYQVLLSQMGQGGGAHNLLEAIQNIQDIAYDDIHHVATSMDADFVYDDAYTFIELNPHATILTSAGGKTTQWQKLKLEVAGLGLPSEILFGNKGEYLKSQMYTTNDGIRINGRLYDGVIVFDDKPSQLIPLVDTDAALFLMRRKGEFHEQFQHDDGAASRLTMINSFIEHR